MKWQDAQPTKSHNTRQLTRSRAQPRQSQPEAPAPLRPQNAPLIALPLSSAPTPWPLHKVSQRPSYAVFHHGRYRIR